MSATLTTLTKKNPIEMSDWDNYKIDNVEIALNAVNKHGTFYYLDGKCDGLPIMPIPTSHVQGVASYNDYIIMTHNSESESTKNGSLIILNKKSNKIVNKINTPSGYNHPGGIQQIGNYLAVSLESEDENIKDSFIRFYDLRLLSDTQPPILFEKHIIYRNDKKSAAVGITTYKENGIDKFLVAVYDHGKVDFYKSNGKLLSDPQYGYEFINSCQLSPGPDNLCLITDREEKVYMMCFRSDDSFVDYMDLHLIDTSTMTINPKGSKYNIHFISNHKMVFNAVGVHFRYGAGIRIVSPQNIEVLATQRNFEITNIFYPSHRKIGINLFPGTRTPWAPDTLVPNLGMSASPGVIDYNGKLYCFHQGYGNNGELWYSVFDGTKWAPDTRVPNVGITDSPAVINYNGKLYCFHQGHEGKCDLWYSIFDGIKWAPDTLVPNVGINSSPAVINYDGKLYCFHRAEGNRSDLWYSVFDGIKWVQDALVPNVGINSSPAVINYNGKLYCFHRAEGNRSDLWYSVFDGIKWVQDALVPNVGINDSPAVINYNGKLYCFHRAEGNRSDLWYSVFDGIKWVQDALVPNAGISGSPAVINYNGELYCFHQGNANSGKLWYSIFYGAK